MATPAYDRHVANEGGVEAIPAEVLAELERLRSLEQRLKSEHRQMRAHAETEIARLHAALRQTADRVKEREREIERLNTELADDGDRHPAPKLLERLEQDRRALEERARALAESEARQRDAQAKLATETKRLAELRHSIESARSPDLGDQLRAEAIRQKDEQRSRIAVAPLLPASAPAPPPPAPSKRERELARREGELTQREVRLALLERRISEAELHLSERAWRAGALAERSADLAAPGFAAGLRAMGLRKRFVTGDGGS